MMFEDVVATVFAMFGLERVPLDPNGSECPPTATGLDPKTPGAGWVGLAPVAAAGLG